MESKFKKQGQVPVATKVTAVIPDLWINRPFNDDQIADLLPGQGYIPYAPISGLHIMDDFGTLQQSLPQRQFDYELHGLSWRCMWVMDIQYMFH